MAYLSLWLGDGCLRALAVALAGSPADRLEYATIRTRARWIADRLAADAEADLYETTEALLSTPMPADRMRRARAAAAQMDAIAAHVLQIRPGCDYPARWVFRSRTVVDLCTTARFWPALANPTTYRTGRMDAAGRHVTINLVPEDRQRIDLDARMRQAEGSFG